MSLAQARNPLGLVARLGRCRQPDLALPSAPRMPHARFHADRAKTADLYREQTGTHTHRHARMQVELYKVDYYFAEILHQSKQHIW